MRPGSRSLRLVAALAAALALGAADDRPSLDTLLDRAAWYLDYFVDQFENVVAEETYIQDATTLLPSYSPLAGGRGGGVTLPPSAADVGRARHRDLRSDFLLVKSPDTLALVPFRDVIAVDGIPVSDRQERLAKLFLSADANVLRMLPRL